MVSTAGFVVSGRVLDANQSPVRTAVTLDIFPSLTPEHALQGLIAVPDTHPDQWVASIESDQDGNFSIGEVPAGTYTLVAPAPADSHRWASIRVTVEKDVTGLKVIIPATAQKNK